MKLILCFEIPGFRYSNDCYMSPISLNGVKWEAGTLGKSCFIVNRGHIKVIEFYYRDPVIIRLY